VATEITESHGGHGEEILGLAHGEALSSRIIGLAIAVHRELGPGLLESVYEECLHAELLAAGLSTVRQVPFPVVYKAQQLEGGFRADLIVEQQVLVEIKAVDHILPVHEAQVLTYLRFSNMPIGLLLNFNTVRLKDGLKRLVR
jgi:GxxExxY protein